MSSLESVMEVVSERLLLIQDWALQQWIDSLEQRINETTMYDARFYDYHEYRLWSKKQWAIMELLCNEMKNRLSVQKEVFEVVCVEDSQSLFSLTMNNIETRFNLGFKSCSDINYWGGYLRGYVYCLLVQSLLSDSEYNQLNDKIDCIYTSGGLL